MATAATTIKDLSQIAVLGAGSWGTAVAHLLATKGYQVTLWGREADVVASINQHHENRLFQPGLTIDSKVRADSNLLNVVRSSALWVLAIPTQYIRPTLKSLGSEITRQTHVVSISKGIENDTLMTISQMLQNIHPILSTDRIGILSGPSFAAEVLKGLPTAVALACPSNETAKQLQQVFHTPFFRTYVSHDMIGVELGGAIKNVIAIGVGVIDGLGFGYNARAALMTRSVAEMIRLASKMGAQPQTLSGLSGMGDLILTCTSDLSRNRTLGLKLGKGESLQTLLGQSPMVVEGVQTAKSVYQLARKHQVEMPIIEQVYLVLHENKSPRQAAQDLLARDPKSEFY